ncbi:MAG TPA: hypothetical protein PK668_08735 [Myxococcota bacterium]|nr:hypothetical protein [Myxococcota bacterium]HRY92936.1 hypothetical protein [Myxococcota bacterium]HSA19845.1 hypothetical protein [Myxococcota bacterium]
MVGALGSGVSHLLRDLEKQLARNGEFGVLRLDLGLPGSAASVRSQGLSGAIREQAQARGTGRPLVVLLDGADRVQGQLAETSRSWPVVAGVEAPRAVEPPAGFEKISLEPMGLRDWIALVGAPSPRLIDYLEHGGLFVSGRENPQRLVERLEQLVLRNVLLRTEVRDPEKLMDMAVDIIGRPGQPVSATRLRKLHTRSLDQARMFLGHLQAAGLIRLVVRLEDRGRKSAQASRLAFSLDTALPLAMRLGTEAREDAVLPGPWMRGWITNAIFVELLKANADVSCWREEDRWGLALPSPAGPEGSVLVDVRFPGEPPPREIEKAMRKLGARQALVFVPGELDRPLAAGTGTAAKRLREGSGLQEVDLATWLMDPVLLSGKRTDIKVGSVMPSRRRSHLL